MFGKDSAEILVALIIFLLAGSDFYKGVLITFTNQTPLLFAAQIGFWIIGLLPKSIRENRYQKAYNEYITRRKWNGLYAIVGGLLGILLSALVFLNA